MLEYRDPSMGVAWGIFSPTSDYENYRSIFRLYTKALTLQLEHEPYEENFKEYFEKKDQLSITLEQEDGKTIPITSLGITDFSNELGEYEVEVHISNPEFFGEHG